jgi:hypothetical protein
MADEGGVLERLLAVVERRLDEKYRKAENAYVAEKFLKVTTNCRYGGERLDGTLHVCRLRCIGTNEFAAATCHPEKARNCGDFEPEKTEAQVRAEFRALPDLRLRWPSLNELFWIREQIRQALGEVEEADEQNRRTHPIPGRGR